MADHGETVRDHGARHPAGAPAADGRRDHVDTRLAHAGHDPRGFHGFVNPPVVHASTVLFETVEGTRANTQPYRYGRRGTPTTDALCRMICELEGAERTVLAPSGLAAVALALLSVTAAGDRVLVADSVYAPTRRICDTVLSRYGVRTTYFDPGDETAFGALLSDPPAAVFLEAPGSVTFDVPDIPSLAAAARSAGARVLMDNTWATPLYFRPLEHGVDLSIQAGTKYFSGHSDLLIGSIAGSGDAIATVADTGLALGTNVGPDDVFMTLRGIRTLSVRLARHQENGLAVARWLAGQPVIHRVLHPALPGAPGHESWKRTFRGASGLFAIVFRDVPREAVEAFVDGLRLFGIGYSWGGFESLAVVQDVAAQRSATRWDRRDQLVRLHVGLEDPADLIADLAEGLDRLARAAAATGPERADPPHLATGA